MTGVARRVLLEKAISIKTIILSAYEEALDEKNAKEIEEQIEETRKKLQTIGENNESNNGAASA